MWLKGFFKDTDLRGKRCGSDKSASGFISENAKKFRGEKSAVIELGADLKRFIKLMTSGSSSAEMGSQLMMLGKNPNRPLGKFSPWGWWIEIVRGCNLLCWHCPMRIMPRGELYFMDRDTWILMVKVINEVAPHTRIEFGNAGEPTLHPNLLEYLAIARKICPHSQILTYTNGTMLINGTVTYKQLFDAGLNMVFVDMYAPFERHRELAEKSGYYWFYQDDKPADAPNIFVHQHNPKVHAIMLAENPSHWSKRKIGRGYLSTFFNDLDWPEATKHGLRPVERAPSRRCDLLYKFVNVNYDGTFTFCCFDYMRHLAGWLGNINGGTGSFLKFWFGEYMQKTRQLLYFKNRQGHKFCSKCAFTSIRCDIPYWGPGLFKEYWNGRGWKKIK